MNFLEAELRSDLRSNATVSVIVVLLLVLSGCARREPGAPPGSKSTVVYAIKDIPENKEIALDAIEQREIEQSMIPEAALYKTDEAVGKISRYGIQEGQIIGTHDLVKYESNVVIDLKNGYGQKLKSIADKKKTTVNKLATDWLHERIERESSK
jgi:hypothetical protein